jgi:HlyD family secretion protein
MATKEPHVGDAKAEDRQKSQPEKKDATRGDDKPAPRASSGAQALPPARNPWPLRIVILLIIAGSGFGIYTWYRITQAARDESHLELMGNIDVRQVNLAFKVEGRIAMLAVDEGDSATVGQVLASLDKRYFEDDLRLAKARRDTAAANLARLEHGSRPEEIAAARANVAERRATQARAKQDFDRAEKLVGQGAVSREDFDRAKAALAESEARLKSMDESLRLAEIGPRQEDIDAARAQFAAEEASVIQSERRLSDADLISPSDGMILTRARETGAIVSPGEPVFTLTLTSPVWVRTYVNEQDLGRIHPGMLAEVRTDSAPKKIYHGRIGFISPTAEFTPKTVETRELRTDLVYRLRVLVDNPDNGLRQGMPVTVTLQLDPPNADKKTSDKGSQDKEH